MALDLFDPAYRRDPYPTLHRERADAPVQQDPLGIWYVLRHADVVALAKDPRLGRDLRRWQGYAVLRPYLADSALERCVEQWMFSLDPPAHTRLRRLVARAFTPKAVARMRGFVEATAVELLDDLEARGRPRRVDLITGFAQAFPVRVIARILGVSVDEFESLKAWSDAIAIVVEPTARRRQKLAANEAVEAMTTHLRAQIARRRASPGDDLLSELLGADEAGDALSEDELVSQLVLMFLAGHETTTNLVGNGMLALARHPDALAQLRAEPTRTPAAVEEMLRYDGPTNTNGRVTHADIDVGGTTIPEGSLLMCMLGAANRDPAVFAEPDRFDVARAPNPHTSFGGGVHFCVGAPLARLEAQVAIDQILRRFSRIDVHEPDVLWRDLVNLRGLASLPLDVTWADRDAR